MGWYKDIASSINKFISYWNKHGFEVALVISIFIIIVMALVRMGKKGTWNDRLYGISSNTLEKKKPPTESKGEIECRKVLEALYKKPFPKDRPSILRNPVTEDFNLELDCYNEELKTAVEYQGAQHYKYIPYFHKSKESFHNQKYRDLLKRQMCEKAGIVLIEVPYTVKHENIKEYLIENLKKAKKL